MTSRRARAVRGARWLLGLALSVAVVGLGGYLVAGLARSYASAGSATARSDVALEREFHSAALDRTMPYALYLPPQYDESAPTRYPVLYMLHGLGGDHLVEWLHYGLFDRADRLIRDGVIAPLIIVLPQGETGYWMDHADGGPSWGAYLAQDVVGEIDATLRALPTPCARAIGGNSMGAHGAIQLSFTYPGTFSIIGAHSPSFRTYEEFGPFVGDEQYFAQHDPHALVEANPEAAARMQWLIDAGEGDPWLHTVVAFRDHLEALGIAHEFRVAPGPHDADYWISQIDRYLIWYDRALQANRDGC